MYPILPVVAHLFLLLKRPPKDSFTGMNEESSDGNRPLTFNNFPAIRKSIKSMNAATMNYLNISPIGNKQNTATKNKEEEEKRMAQKKKVLSDYYAAEYYAAFTTAISGGIESPIQFIIQVFKKLYHNPADWVIIFIS